MSGHKVVAISQRWLAFWSTIAAALVVGGITYAWNANADFAVVKSQLAPLVEAGFPERLARIESKLDDVQEMKAQQSKMDDKLDKLLTRTQ